MVQGVSKRIKVQNSLVPVFFEHTVEEDLLNRQNWPKIWK